eukprot:7293343-Prymnesium_polylepis.2
MPCRGTHHVLPLPPSALDTLCVYLSAYSLRQQKRAWRPVQELKGFEDRNCCAVVGATDQHGDT